ncbi:MAG: Cytochrome b6-f complex iron-sulfur subunit [Candidatus Omnitrophica bacterium]|nr:Cytochrome b6-f complex iron-sulfur subunit [Candidatus Omnitrophota bacterium]
MSDSTTQPPAPPQPEAPKTPVAPAKPAAVTPDKISRRSFLSWAGVAWFSFGAATTGALSIVLRYLFPNVIFEPPTSFKAGPPSEYEVGVVDERWKEKFGVWIVRSSEGIFALSTICTHLGCTPNWLSSENRFKCPCHGSGFYKSGINFEGPAPRPLERYRIQLADDGQILIDKSKKYQQEKGEWNNPESFLVC